MNHNLHMILSTSVRKMPYSSLYLNESIGKLKPCKCR